MAITDFILQRTAEDEAAANRLLDAREVKERWSSASYDDHPDQWSPWRVHAACIANRLLVRAHLSTGTPYGESPGAEQGPVAGTCQTCRDDEGRPAAWPCYTLKVLASEWSDHPDYRNEWRPLRRRPSSVPAGPASPPEAPRPPGQRAATPPTSNGP